MICQHDSPWPAGSGYWGMAGVCQFCGARRKPATYDHASERAAERRAERDAENAYGGFR